MTKRTVFGFMVVCSFTLNIALIGIWLTHSVPSLLNKCQCDEGMKNCRKCPLQSALRLSDSQWVPLEPRIRAFHKSSTAIYKEIAGSRAALIDELEKPEPDSATVLMYIERIQAGQNKMQLLVVEHILEKKSILTSGQQKRFFEMMRANMACPDMSGMMGTIPHNCAKPDASAGE